MGTINAFDPTYLRSAYFTAFYSAFYTHVASVVSLAVRGMQPSDHRQY